MLKKKWVIPRDHKPMVKRTQDVNRLYQACCRNDIELVKKYITDEKFLISLDVKNLDNIVEAVVIRNHHELLDVILKNKCFQIDNFDSLIISCDYGFENIVKVIIKHTQVTINFHNDKALSKSCKANKYPEIIKVLVEWYKEEGLLLDAIKILKKNQIEYKDIIHVVV